MTDDGKTTEQLVEELEAMRRRAQKLEAVVENLTDHVMLVDLQLNILFINHTFPDLTKSDVVGMPLLRFTPDEFKKTTEEAYARVLATGQPTRYETEYHSRDAQTSCLEVHVGPVLREGEIVAFTSRSTDITDRKRADEALRASEARLRAITETALDSIFCKDLDSRYTFVNPAMGRLFGKPPAELVGLTPRDLFDAESAALVEAVDAPVFLGEVTDAVRTLDIQGEERTFHTIQVPLRDTEGEVEGICGIVRDVTETKRAERRLRLLASAIERSESLYRTLFEGIANGINLVDRDGVVIMINKAGAKYLGRTPDECVGKSIFDLVPGLDESYRGHYRQVVDTGVEVITEEFVELSSGPRWFGAVLHAVEDENSVRYAVLVISYDITERKLAEEERRNLEAQVQHSQKLESLGILAGGIAHDFNNILSAVLGNADLALHDLPSRSPVRPLLYDIMKASKRAADLTGQMLAYSGKGHFVIEDIDINALVLDISSLLESATSKKVTLSYGLASELPAVRADATQLRQIVMNLVRNASEAVGIQGGLVGVKTHVTQYDLGGPDVAFPGGEPVEGRYVVIEVSDTGCGMDDETKARVFDPFFTTKKTGSGLGLAAVQGIVRGHKGAILVESDPGKGTTFKVLLPALDHSAEVVAAGTKGKHNWRCTGTILVADDEEAVRLVATQMLKRFGFSVQTASDGAEAVALFRDHHEEIDCVLLDLKMPVMDGEEALGELRRIRSDVPVILSSGYGEQESTVRFSEMGLSGFLQKPYGLVQMEEQLRKAMASRT